MVALPLCLIICLWHCSIYLHWYQQNDYICYSNCCSDDLFSTFLPIQHSWLCQGQAPISATPKQHSLRLCVCLTDSVLTVSILLLAGPWHLRGSLLAQRVWLASCFSWLLKDSVWSWMHIQQTFNPGRKWERGWNETVPGLRNNSALQYCFP